MAIATRNSDEVTVKEGRMLYSGLANCKIIAVNPNLAELATIGVNYIKAEPVYVEKETDKPKTRLDFWVQTDNDEKVLTKLSLWIEHSHNKSAAGNEQVINKYGRTAFKSGAYPWDWYKTDGVRPAYKGEEELHKLLQAFFNVVYNDSKKEYDECLIDSPEKIILGDMTELRNLINSKKDNTVRLLFGVKDNQYQNIYNKHFERTCVKANLKKWQEVAIDAEYGAFQADFQNNWTFKSYMISAEAPKPDADVKAQTDVF